MQVKSFILKRFIFVQRIFILSCPQLSFIFTLGKFMARLKKGKKAWKEKEVKKIGNELLEWFNASDEHWWIKEFATIKGIPYEYFENEFQKVSGEFREQFNYCKNLQEVRCVKLIASGSIPPTFGIFMSKNILNYRDSQDLRHAGKITSEVKIGKEELDKVFGKIFPKRSTK